MNKNDLMHGYSDIQGHIHAQLRFLTSSYEIHWHTYFEIELVLEGEAIHNLNGVEKHIKHGDLVLISPTDFHSITPISPMKIWNVSFDESLLSAKRLTELSSPTRKKEFTFKDESLEKIVFLIKLLESEIKMPNAGCSRELCECLLTVIERQGGKQEGGMESGGGIGRAILYMNIHFRDNPSLDTAAAQARLHPHYFSELFKKSTGKSYCKYLTALKIEYAKNMLDAGFSVTEACHVSGFGSLSAFLSAFKKSIGISPNEYKKQKNYKTAFNNRAESDS